MGDFDCVVCNVMMEPPYLVYIGGKVYCDECANPVIVKIEAALATERGKMPTVLSVLPVLQERIDADCARMSCVELEGLEACLARLADRVREHRAKLLDDSVR